MTIWSFSDPLFWAPSSSVCSVPYSSCQWYCATHPPSPHDGPADRQRPLLTSLLRGRSAQHRASVYFEHFLPLTTADSTSSGRATSHVGRAASSVLCPIQCMYCIGALHESADDTLNCLDSTKNGSGQSYLAATSSPWNDSSHSQSSRGSASVQQPLGAPGKGEGAVILFVDSDSEA